MQHNGRVRGFAWFAVSLMALLTLWHPVRGLLAQEDTPSGDVAFLQISSVNIEEYPTIKVAVNALGTDRLGVGEIPVDDWEFQIDDEPVEGEIDFDTATAPMAVAIVIDTSYLMGDTNTPQRTRFRDMIDQINDLMSRLPGNTDIAIISVNSTSQVVFPLQADGGGARNAITQLAPAEKPPEPSYDLLNGIKLGLNELQSATDKVRGLFIFAAGDPNIELDATEAKFLIDSQEVPPSVALIAFGSNQEGTFEKNAANPDILQRTAQTLGAPTLHFYTNDIGQIPDLITKLHVIYDGFVNRSEQPVAVFEAGQIEPGEHTLTLKIDKASAEFEFEAPTVRPKLTIYAPKRPITATTTLSVTIDYAQTEITEVEYVLNNTPIGTSTEAPNFPFELDPAAPDIRASFVANESYKLFAATTDQNDEAGRSDEVNITMNPAKTGSVLDIIKENILIVAIVGGLLVLLLAFFLYKFIAGRRRQQVFLAPSSTGPKAPERQFTGNRGKNPPPSPMMAPPAIEATQEFAPPPPPPVYGGSAHTEEFVTGAPSFTEEYTVEQPMFFVTWKARVYEPGREPVEMILNNRKSMTIGKDPGHEISIQNRWVSRSHATLQITRNGVEITDLHSRNKTYVYQSREELTPEESVMLQSGDIFWIGPEVKIELIEDQ